MALTEQQHETIKTILAEFFGAPRPRLPAVLDWRSGSNRRGLIRASLDTASGMRVRLWYWPDRPPDDVVTKLKEAGIPYHITVPPASEIAKAMKPRD